MESHLVNSKFQLERFPGKGGWTYALILQVLQDKNAPFGWVKVKGSIDDFEFKNYKLMPMGNGKLFFPVKAEIRKKIRKKEGDWVHIILYADNEPTEIPDDILMCLNEEPNDYKLFLSYTDGQQKAFIDWINSAKREETRVDRITKMLEMLPTHQLPGKLNK